MKLPGSGTPYSMRRYLFESSAGAFVFQTAVYPSEVDTSNPQANLQGGLDTAAKSLNGGKWISVTWLKHQGLTAIDAVGLIGDNEIRTFSLLRGQQIFALTYAGPDGTARAAEVDRFFASLRIR